MAEDMKIKTVAVLGAGAVGSYIVWGLTNRKDVRLGVIADGERAKRLKNNGCLINGVTYHPEVWTPQAAENIDFLVVALKYGALQTALDSIIKKMTVIALIRKQPWGLYLVKLMHHLKVHVCRPLRHYLKIQGFIFG